MDGHKVAAQIRSLADQVELEQCSGIQPLTLGSLIVELERSINEAERGGGEYITFDWGSCFPTGFCSYRGWYERTSLEFSGSQGDHMTAGAFLTICKNAVGMSVYGYKGGEYFLDENEPMYVACAGMTSSTRVVGVRAHFGIELVTAQIEE